MKIIKQLVSTFFRVGTSLILIVVVFKFTKIDLTSLLGNIKGADKPVLFLAFCIFLINYVLCLLRWQMLLEAVKIHLPLKRVIISFSGGIFFSLFLPSTIGGDLMRSIDLATHTKKPSEVIATVFLDRLSGYIGLVILTLLSLLFGWRLIEDRSVFVSVAIIFFILAALLLVLFNRFIYSKINGFLGSPGAGKIRQLLNDLHEEIHIFRDKKRVVINNVLLSIVIQAITPIAFYIIAISLGIRISLLYFFIFLPIIGAITLLPISIGGLGLRDASIVYFFAKAGVSHDLAFAMSLLSFFFILSAGAAGGLIYVLTIHHRRIQHHQPSGIPQARK